MTFDLFMKNFRGDKPSRGTNLTRDDWEIILCDVKDFGSLRGTIEVLKMLPKRPIKKEMEELLCTALCAGDGKTAIKICSLLQRELTAQESRILLENTILTGNVMGFYYSNKVKDFETRIQFHTTVTIGVLRCAYRKRTGAIPNANLTSWRTVYKREMNIFFPEGEMHASTRLPKAELIFCSPATLHRLVGALLLEGLITEECIKEIMNFSN